MNAGIYVVDAFTAEPFGGNPAAVCLLADAVDAAWMQAVAAEMNLSETAFLSARDPGDWDLRWFTPTTEVDLCGHATLAAAHVLWHERAAAEHTLNFHTRSGWLKAVREGDAIQLDFPADHPAALAAPAHLGDILGATPLAVARGDYDWLVQLADAAAVRAVAPDFARLQRLDARGVVVTAASDDPTCDFVSRFFAPRAGIPEDPVTGSAHCLLAPYWSEKLDRTTLRGYQASRRGGVVEVTLQGSRVLLRGHAVTTLAGELRV